MSNIKNLIKNNKRIYTFLVRKYEKHLENKLIRQEKKQMRRMVASQKNDKFKVYLLGIPEHTNLGDNAQTYCILNWLKKTYPEYTQYSYSSFLLNKYDYYLLRQIKKALNKQDKIFMQSGYNTTDLYMAEEDLHRKVLGWFTDSRVVILPQTVFFKSPVERQNTVNIYNKHNNMVFFARDEVSYNEALNMFPQKKVYLYPDIVTSLIGTYDYTYHEDERDGILLCLRNDIEAFLSKEEVKRITDDLSKEYKVELTDTTIKGNLEDIKSSREKYLNTVFYNYSKYKLIITDRYHGTIFSLVAGTPVIVLNSTDHKLSSGVKWFEGIPGFENYVYFCKDIGNLKDVIKQAITAKRSEKLPKYFSETYYDKLDELIK